MKNLKKIQAAHYTGLLLCLFGILSQHFMMLRPNRIEKGVGIRLIDEVRKYPLLFMLTCILLVLILIFLYLNITYVDFSIKVSILESMIALSGFSLFFFITAGLASYSVEGAGTSARVSLGLGFWCLFIGQILFLRQAALRNFRTKIMIVLYVFLFILGMYLAGYLENISLIIEFNNKAERITTEFANHMMLSLSASIVGFVISFMMSYLVYRHKRFEGLIVSIANFAQVIPTLSMLGLLMIPLTALSKQFPVLKAIGISGIGFFPAFIVLTLYTLLPNINNALAGFRSIPQHVTEAAQAMGMSRRQRLFKVELAMALPSLFTGFRIALVQSVGNCVLAGLVGGGGLGSILFLGLAQSAPDLVVVASLIVVSIAVLFEVFLTTLEMYFKKRMRGDLIYD